LNHRQELENEVAEIFSLKLHVEVPSFDYDLFETGILDSLQFVELLFQLEQQFGVRISLDEIDLENFRSIERISLMLANQNGNGNGKRI
jgi:methoxymalonate biosynthesis acyl carrier protein